MHGPTVIRVFLAQPFQLRAFVVIEHHRIIGCRARLAAATHHPSNCSPTPISAATCATGRPVSTSRRTAYSRYSGVYFLRFPDTGTSFPQNQQFRDQMSTIRGQPPDGRRARDLVVVSGSGRGAWDYPNATIYCRRSGSSPVTLRRRWCETAFRRCRSRRYRIVWCHSIAAADATSSRTVLSMRRRRTPPGLTR